MGIKKEVTCSYLEKYPKLSIRGVSQLIYDENVSVYKNYEDARISVRYYRGKMGLKRRERLADKRFILPIKTSDNQFQLPTFAESTYTPYYVPSDIKKILCIADLHYPYTSKCALELALRDGKRNKIDCVIIDGDLVDSHQLSRFQHDPRKRSYKDEIDGTKTLLYAIRKQFPNAKIIFKEGNHDRRLEDYLMTKAPQLLGFEEFHLSVLLDLHNLGIDYVGDKRVIYCGKLNIIHGDEYKNGVTSPANPARTSFLRTKAQTLSAHNHQTTEHTEPTIREDLITCWSVGCLCDLHPEYMPLNKWCHGYALIEKDRNGNFQVDNKRIFNGKVL